jgi:esterase
MSHRLHSRCSGAGPAVILLHGLFGAGGNLGALGRHLAAGNTVYAPDLPGHGRSDWCSAYSLGAMAETLVRWMDAQGLARAHVVGHSLGGKVAMQLALSYPDRLDSLVVADIAPVSYSGRHDAVFAALQAVALERVASRSQAQQIMQHFVQEAGVIEFLLASLRRDQQGVYDWMFDRQGLQRDYPALLAAPAPVHTGGAAQAIDSGAGQGIGKGIGEDIGEDIDSGIRRGIDNESGSPGVSQSGHMPAAGRASAGGDRPVCWEGPTLFLKGADSDYIGPQHLPVIAKMFPRSEVVTLEHSGHWLHVQQPALFNACVADFQSAQQPAVAREGVAPVDVDNK